MKITIIHGQNHRGTTAQIARKTAEKIGGPVTEFFLPGDFNRFCVGCGRCFMESEQKCPHYGELRPITRAMEEADLIILASPVYVYHASGPMKAFLDHYGYQWMVHRPRPEMFHKQGICISTAAGAGCRSANRDMADSLRFWGIPVIHRLGLRVRVLKLEHLTAEQWETIERKTDRLARRAARCKPGRPGIRQRIMFRVMRSLHRRGFTPADDSYWKEQGWLEGGKPWK